MNTKPLYQSKTFWLNALTLISALFPVVQEWIKENPIAFVESLGALNVLVRFFTKDKVILWSDDKPKGGGSKMVLPLMLIGVVGLSLTLVSCATPARSPITGIVYGDGSPKVDAQTSQTLFRRFGELLAGRKPKDILREAFPVVEIESAK